MVMNIMVKACVRMKLANTTIGLGPLSAAAVDCSRAVTVALPLLLLAARSRGPGSVGLTRSDLPPCTQSG